MGLSFHEAIPDLIRFVLALKKVFSEGFLCEDCRAKALKEFGMKPEEKNK